MPFETRQHPNFLRRHGSRLALVLIAGGNCSSVLVGLPLVTDGRFVFLVAAAVGVVTDDHDVGFNTGAKVFLPPPVPAQLPPSLFLLLLTSINLAYCTGPVSLMIGKLIYRT